MTQNAINTGYIASSMDAIIGADTRKLIVPSTLKDVANSIRSSAVGSTYNLRLSFDGTNLSMNTYSDNTPSSSNPAYVVTRSKAVAGKAVLQTITSANTFAQTGLLNNLFGTVGGTAWSSAMPMFVYCVTDDTDANPVFAISRVPHLVISPTVANSGSPSSSTADVDQAFFYFNAGTVLANYDQNPCVCLGSLEMSKSALDAWTISTVHPLGDFRSQTKYTFPGYGSGYFLE